MTACPYPNCDQTVTHWHDNHRVLVQFTSGGCSPLFVPPLSEGDDE